MNSTMSYLQVTIPAGAGSEEMKGDVEKARTRNLALPAGTVLAYQVVELAVRKDGMELSCY